MGKLLSVNAFSKLVDVSHTAVAKAIKSGRLLRSVVLKDDGSIKGIDPELGLEEWSENSPGVVSPKTKALNDEDLPLPSGLSYADARAVREVYQARLAKLLYEEKMGRLVDAENAEKEFFELGRTVRNSVLTVPDRYGHELAAETDVNRFTEKLTRVLIESLEQAANERTLDRTTDSTA
jgi:hypothetical protein